MSHVDSVSHMGSACLTCLSWAVRVSHGQCVSDVGSVCLTWAVCVSRGQCVSHTGGYAVGSDQSSRKMVALSGRQMEGCVGLLSIGTYSPLS